MKRHLKALVACLLLPLSGAVLGGCSAGEPGPASAAAASVASECNPARCGERPLMHATECHQGGYAGVAECVKNPEENGCGWLVTSCGG